MQDEIHPPYQEVLFVDSSTGFKFVCGSTLQPKEREVFEGKEYPVYRVPISSDSHPFFKGTKELIDTGGRVSRFTERYKQKIKDTQKEKEKEKERAEKKVTNKKKEAGKKTVKKVAKKTESAKKTVKRVITKK